MTGRMIDPGAMSAADKLLLVMCPYAGASRSMFRQWDGLDDARLTMTLATYPGRDHRMREPCADSILSLAETLTEEIAALPEQQRRSLILAGHSMGAQVAFETCRALEAGGLAPAGLVLSGCHAPHLRSRRRLSHRDDAAFVDQLVEIGGFSAELRANRDLLDVFMPMLRADFLATESYERQVVEPCIQTPTLLLYGSGDIEATPDEVEAWQEWICGPCALAKLDGDHFYVTRDPGAFIAELVRTFSTSRAGASAAPPASPDPHTPAVPTLFACLHESAQRHADRTAIVCDDVRLSYASLFMRVAQLAGGFHRLGMQRGERVMVQMPNSVGFVEVLLACLRIGLVPVLAMPTQRARDIDALCRLAEPVAYFIPDRTDAFDFPAFAADIKTRHPSLRHIVVDGASDAFHALADIRGEPPDVASHAPADVALLLISGGTTGTPKLIPRTYGDYAYNVQAMADACAIDARSVYLAVIPIAHNFSLACPGILGTLAHGGTVVLAVSPSCDETMPLIERERVTHVALVPPLAQLWVDAREWEDSDLSSLRVVQVGGSRLAPDLAEQVMHRLGGTLQQVFGMAEGLLCLTRLDDDEDTIINTQGRPLSPDDELRIVDQNGRDVADGERGELWTRGPYTIRGYFRAAEHNGRAFTPDGFYRTGDLVRRHGSNLVVDGRIKEQIQRGGEKLSVVELEDSLRRCDGIDAAKVVAVPDKLVGERACAFLIGAQGSVDEMSLRTQLLAQGLGREKVPDQFEWLPSWPLTAVGKIDTQRLIEVAQERDA